MEYPNRNEKNTFGGNTFVRKQIFKSDLNLILCLYVYVIAKLVLAYDDTAYTHLALAV